MLLAKWRFFNLILHCSPHIAALFAAIVLDFSGICILVTVLGDVKKESPL